MALCLWASVYALVASSSLRALLAFSQSSAASVGGVMLPDQWSWLWERWWWGSPLEMLLPSQHSPRTKYPPAEGVPLACEVEA